MERRNGIALWRQIADNIRTDIGSGVFDEARKLTPEHELARRFRRQPAYGARGDRLAGA